MESYQLKNGISFLSYRMTNTHSVCLSVFTSIGLECENADNCGIRHVLEHLHFRSLNDYSQDDLYFLMESLGSSLKGKTYRDFIHFSMKVIPGNLNKILNIFSNIISTSDWKESDFEKEKKVVLGQISLREEYVNIYEESNKLIFADTPLSLPIGGISESVKTLSLKQVKDFKRQYFVGSNIFVCLTGNFDSSGEKDTIRMLERIDLPIGTHYFQNIQLPEFNNRRNRVNIIRTDDYYLDVCVSFDYIEDKAFSIEDLKVLNCILGEGVGSKLQRKIREETGITSDIYSEIEISNPFCVLCVKFTVSQDKLTDCLKSVLTTINNIKTQITVSDLHTSLPFYKENLIMLEDDPEEMNFKLGYDLFICKHNNIHTELNYDLSSSERLMALAKQLFVIRNCTATIIGDCQENVKEIIQLIKSYI